MAGQPVKRGNWGDWATIEHTPRSEKRCCGGCIHYCYEDDSCKVRPIVVYEVGADFWKTCPQYCYNIDAVLKSPYIPQHPPADDSSKKQIRYKPNPAITLGMDVIDENNRVGKITRLSYTDNLVHVQYNFGVVSYHFPDVFIKHRLKKYYKSSNVGTFIDYFEEEPIPTLQENLPIVSSNKNHNLTSDKSNTPSKTKTSRKSNASNKANIPSKVNAPTKKQSTQQKNKKVNNATSTTTELLPGRWFREPPLPISELQKFAMAITEKKPTALQVSDFPIGFELFALGKGIGYVRYLNPERNRINVLFTDGSFQRYRIPDSFIDDALSIPSHFYDWSVQPALLPLIKRVSSKPVELLQASDFSLDMEIVDIYQGIGIVRQISPTKNQIALWFHDGSLKYYNIPRSFLNGHLKVYYYDELLPPQNEISRLSNLVISKDTSLLQWFDFVRGMAVVDKLRGIGHITHIYKETSQFILKFNNDSIKRYNIPYDFVNGTVKVIIE